ncbi:MAG: hypothetical protein ACRD12_19925, partial [Acidimicrobiales bacterium]
MTAFGVQVAFPGTVTVGAAGLPASLTITNTSTGAEATGSVTLQAITLVPACATFDPQCAGAGDPGAFALSPTGVGAAGSACAGRTFNIGVITPATGQVQFFPVGGPVMLGPVGASPPCTINFTFNVIRVPNADSNPAPGVQTNQVAQATGVHDNGTRGTGVASSTVTVLPAAATISTVATASAPVGQAVIDTATVTGVAGSPAPTGTVTFMLFGPANPNCTGAPAFTSANRPLGGGPPPTAMSSPFNPGTPGQYNWVASYSGDANYLPLTAPCGASNEATLVTPPAPVITTMATPVVFPGQPISDTASVTGFAGVPAPTGTVTFTVFGPNDTTCTGAPVFTSAAQPLSGGPPTATATSGPFTPTVPGTYRWIAAYSGDANYIAVTTACNDANETSVVTQATPTIATQATPTASIGQSVQDTATVTGLAAGPAPTGTVTFTLFGPNNATCTGAPIFT